MSEDEVQAYVAEIVVRAEAESAAAGVVQAAMYAEAKAAKTASLASGGSEYQADQAWWTVIRRHNAAKWAVRDAEAHAARAAQAAADRLMYGGGSAGQFRP